MVNMLNLQFKAAGAEGCRCCTQHKHARLQQITLHWEYLGLPSPLARARKGVGVSRMRSAAATTAVATAEQAGLAKDERRAADESSRLTGRKVKVIGASPLLTCSLLAAAACTPPGLCHVLYTAGEPCISRVPNICAIQLCCMPCSMLAVLARSQIVCVLQAWGPGATVRWSG